MSLFDAIAGIGGSLIGAGADIYGANMAADAARRAGRLQYNQYLQSRKDYEPWRQAGLMSLADLTAAVNRGDFSKFYTSPGYQYRQDEGRRAIERSASARGALDSGATLKALSDYGQQTASDEYSNYLNRLYGLAGYGREATANTANLGANAAAGYGQGIANAGYLRGTGYSGGINNFLNNIYGYGAYNGWFGGQ